MVNGLGQHLLHIPPREGTHLRGGEEDETPFSRRALFHPASRWQGGGPRVCAVAGARVAMQCKIGEENAALAPWY
jgi:hypothetical protein